MAVLNSIVAAASNTILHYSFKANPRFLLPLKKWAVAALPALHAWPIRCKTDTPTKGRFIPVERRWMYEGVEKIGPFSYRSSHMVVMQRLYSTHKTTEEEYVPLESEMRKRVGWLIKILAAVTITYVSFNMFPLMGDSLIWQSVALVRLDDPFMKRSGASRISMIATNDKRRKNFVEAGGVSELAKMLQSAPDDKTRREAVKALVSLCECSVAVEALHATGAEGFLKSLVQGSSDADVESHSLILLKKLEQWRGGAK